MISNLQTTLVTDWGKFQELSDEWNELLRKTNADSIFLTWEWVNSCGQAIEWAVIPNVVVVRDKDLNLVGAAPFYVGAYKLFGMLPIKVLRLLPDVVNGSEYIEIIAAKYCEDEIYQCIFNALLNQSKVWDCIWLCRMSGWTGAKERISKACSKNSTHANTRAHSFSAVSLPGSFSNFLAQLSARSRSQLRRELRKIFEKDAAKFCICNSATELPEYLEALFSLHRMRWKSVGQEGSFARSPTEKNFHSIFAPIALSKNWLRLAAISKDERIRAVQIGYVYNKTFNSLQEGFDPAYLSGSGNALRGRIIESAIQEGIQEYDFLGEHTYHKGRWSAKERFGVEFMLSGASMIGKLIVRLGIWPTGRYLRPTR